MPHAAGFVLIKIIRMARISDSLYYIYIQSFTFEGVLIFLIQDVSEKKGIAYDAVMQGNSLFWCPIRSVVLFTAF